MHRARHSVEGRRIEVFGDESLKRGGYDLLGALWAPAPEIAALRADVSMLRRTTAAPNPEGEIKWTKCSGAHENPLYSAAVDLVMSRILERRVRFKCIVVNRALVDNATWNGGDVELGFYKAWHTLLFSIIDPGWLYHVRLDARQLQKHTRLQDLQDVLNARGRRDRGFDYRCCSMVEGADSKKDDLVQVADLLTGAVGFHFAGGHRDPAASPGKLAIAARICRHLRRNELCFASPPFEQRFNVWVWKPRRQREKR